MRKLTVCAVLALLVVAFGASTPAQADHVAGGGGMRVAIPAVGTDVAHDQVLVATGRRDSNAMTTCGDYAFHTNAVYGVLVGQGQEGYARMIWQTSPNAGMRFSAFTLALGANTCTFEGTSYTVYQVSRLD